MNSIDGNTTRSPQVRRSSFPPCRPHTPCLRARCASISFALRLQARISALVADRFASGLCLGYGPEIQRKPFGFHLAMDTLPSSQLMPRGRRVLPDLLSTHPPCEGAAGLSPAREAPCWAHNPNPTITWIGDDLAVYSRICRVSSTGNRPHFALPWRLCRNVILSRRRRISSCVPL
jgi:hypothetical protein